VRLAARTIVYVTDTAPLSRPNEGIAAGESPIGREMQMIEFLRGADIVVFDTMFSLPEYLEKMTWGHSYPEYAVALCGAAGVQALYLFHHAPDASDADMDQLAEQWSTHAPMRVCVAREGMSVNLEG
jgi:ribonuclease BN (tRNA processing enzyme)